jgi:hypothetical protein
MNQDEKQAKAEKMIEEMGNSFLAAGVMLNGKLISVSRNHEGEQFVVPVISDEAEKEGYSFCVVQVIKL